MAKNKTKTPVHQWTNGGSEVLILRFSDKDGKSHGGFQHPLEVGKRVTAKDWKPNQECGGGIHGWAWGIGIGDGKDADWIDGLWQVYGVKSTNVIGEIDGGIKCKFKTGMLRFVGGWYEAMMFILDGQKAWVEHFTDGQSSATGYKSASSATGYNSASSATGKASAAVVTGEDGVARAGEYGCIALSWWNKIEQRFEMRCAETGCGDGSDGKLKANVWYQLNELGEFVEKE